MAAKRKETQREGTFRKRNNVGAQRHYANPRIEERPAIVTVAVPAGLLVPLYGGGRTKIALGGVD